jgi:hypothetical protein
VSEASAYALLFVLTCSLAGVGVGAALFYRREVPSVALYEVVRVDDVQPGEFDNAFVIAGGVALARASVAHLLPKGAQVVAARVELTGVPTKLLSTYFDEREPAAPALDHFPEAHEAW